MARIRSIKPAAFTSESLAAVSIAANWTFAGLWTYVDDEGRGKADARLIKGALYPLRDEITPDDVRAHLAELESVASVCRYSAGGRDYIHVVNFLEHQTISKPTASKLPPCPIDHEGPGHHGDSSDSGDSQGILDFPGESPLGTGNREVEQGTGNRERAGRAESDPMARFPEFWSAYPRSDDRPAAEAKWRAALKRGIDPQRIIDGAIRYRGDPNRTAKYTKHGATWLNNACWDNGPLPGDDGKRPASERIHSELDSMKDPDRQAELRAVPGGI